MKRLICFLACYLILFTSALALSDDSNNTILNNTYYGIDWIVNQVTLPVAAIISILIFIVSTLISEYKDKAKLEQYYTVCTNIKKLKPKDFDINIYSDYIKKGSHDSVLNLIKTGEKRILIKGVSGLGKTRTIYEVIKEFGARCNFLVNKLNNIRIPERFQRLISKVPIPISAKNISGKYTKNGWKDYFVIVPSKDIKLPIKVPKDYFLFKRRFILFFDDLDKYVSRKIDINNIIHEFEKNSEHLIVLATCREEEFQILETEKVQENFVTLEQDLFSYEEGEKLAKSIGKKFNRNEFDFTPSSIILESPRKKCYWNGFTESEKNILRAIKLLNLSNIFKPQTHLIKKVHENIFSPNNDKFNTHFHDLKDKKFIFPEKDAVFCADYYLSKIVEDYPLENQLFSDMLKLRDVLIEKNSWENLINLGSAFYFKKEYQNSISCLDKALEINPKGENALIIKGVALAESGKHTDAINCFDKALEINPKSEIAFVNKGNILDEVGKHTDAINCFDKALEINSKDEVAWYNKGLALGNLGKYDDAIVCYDRTLEINSRDVEALVNKGGKLVDIYGKYDEAINCFDKALEVNPNKIEAWFGKGNALLRYKRYHDAIICFNKALEINPKYECVLNNKGVALAESGKHIEAIECFDKALEINSKDENAWFGKGIALVKSCEHIEAINCFDKALKINPNDDNILCHKGSALSRLGNYTEAIKCFEKVLDIDPKHNDAHYKKARTLSLFDKYDEAIKYLSKYLETNPKDDVAWVEKAMIMSKYGKSDEAISCLDEALKISPMNNSGWYIRACILSIKGDKNEALYSLKKAIELNPSYKKDLKKDKDFEKLWDDEDFKNLAA